MSVRFPNLTFCPSLALPNTDTHCKTLSENTALLESAGSSKLPHVPTVVAVATLSAQTGLAAFAAHASASHS